MKLVFSLKCMYVDLPINLYQLYCRGHESRSLQQVQRCIATLRRFIQTDLLQRSNWWDTLQHIRKRAEITM